MSESPVTKELTAQSQHYLDAVTGGLELAESGQLRCDL
jgi:hypothetical protein